MSRPTVEVADLIRTHGDSFVAENRSSLSYQQLKVSQSAGFHTTTVVGYDRGIVSFSQSVF